MRTDGLGALNKIYYPGKHEHHGVNLQRLADPYGRLWWISDGLPGSTHDLTAARHHDVLLTTARAGLYLYVDKGYVSGEGDTLLVVPYKGRDLPTTTKNPTAPRRHQSPRRTRLRGPENLEGPQPIPRLHAPSPDFRPRDPHPRT